MCTEFCLSYCTQHGYGGNCGLCLLVIPPLLLAHKKTLPKYGHANAWWIVIFTSRLHQMPPWPPFGRLPMQVCYGKCQSASRNRPLGFSGMSRCGWYTLAVCANSTSKKRFLWSPAGEKASLKAAVFHPWIIYRGQLGDVQREDDCFFSGI